ncbi:ABC transporter permease [Glycomyces tarimensis]
MLGPSIAMARRQLGGLVAVACAVLGGAAMVTASAVLGETGLASHLPPERLADADVLVSAKQSYPVVEDLDLPLRERVTIPASLVEDVRGVDGVESAAADLTFPVSIPALGAPAEGHSWATAALSDPALEGAPPNGADQTVLDRAIADAAGLTAGDRVEIAHAGGRDEYVVAGVVDAPGTGAYFEASAAAALAAHPEAEVDLIAVTIEPGASVESVAAGIGRELASEDLLVTTGEARGDVESLEGGAARGELIAMVGSLSGTLLILVGFIVAGALSVAVASQRRDLALLRAVGATPRQVRRLIAAQASVAAVVGIVPGVALGYALAGGFAEALTGAGMLPEALPLARGPVAGIIAVVLLLVTVQLAARGAAMRASRMSATEAVAESRVEPKEPSRVRTVIGLVLLVLALTQSALPLFVRSEAAFISSSTGTLVAVIGLAMAGPALVRAITGRAARRLNDRTSAPAWLAVNNSRAYALRMAGSVTVLALAIGLTVTQVFTQTTLERTSLDQLEEGTAADAVVTGESGVSPADASELATAEGIDAVVPLAPTSVIRANEVVDGSTEVASYPALAVGEGAGRVLDLGVESGDLADLEGETVAISASTAWMWRLDVGDRIDLVLDNGAAVSPTVVATYERGFGFGDVVLAADLLAAHHAPRFFDAALVDGDAAAVAAWTGDHPGLAALDPSSVFAPQEGVSPDRWIGLMVTLALMGYVLLGVANSLVASTARRRGEFAALRMVGATPRQIKAMVRREALVMSALAIGAGAVVSVLPMSLLGLGFTGVPWPQGPLWVIPAIAAVTAAIAYAATMAPTRRALAESPTAVLATAG